MVVDIIEVLEKTARILNVNMTIIKEGEETDSDYDLGLRRILLEDGEQERFLRSICHLGEEGVISFVADFFETEYCVVRVPASERQYGDFIVVGPYRDMILEELRFNEMLEMKVIPRDYANELKEYYNAVPVVANMEQWREFWVGMFRILYHDEPLRREHVNKEMMEGRFRQDTARDELSFKIIEERYKTEGELMEAVSKGNTEEALKALNAIRKFRLAARYKDPVRNIRNILISMNTLCRKAAEMGGVHPAHVDSLSAQLAKRIETVNSSQESGRFSADMLRKYCLLVQNHSLRGCSPVVQKVVNHINLNLTEDLSLKRLSAEYSVNASYLSALFKKEMGTTLTDYISQQRIRRAITLINSTNLQIQDIASESGIYDVNYFRKLFKKVTGKTPTEYAKQVRSYSKRDMNSDNFGLPPVMK